MCEGIELEFEGLQLGDARLNRRGKKIIRALAADSQASINAACDGWSDTIAAYRFFDHPDVTPEKLNSPHRAATVRRIAEHPTVLIVQDTTELDFTAHPPHDARCLDKASRFGLFDHTLLAVTPERLCLGVVGGVSFDRAPESLGRTAERNSLPIEEKESYRWLLGYQEACRIAAENPGTRVVSVGDREADLYDIFVDAAREDAGPRADFLVRARLPRCLPERDSEAGEAAYRRVRDEVNGSKLLGVRTLDLPQTPKRAARTATLEIRALTVTIKPPHARSRLPEVVMQVVSALETGGPGDGTDVSWLLLTSLPVSGFDEALRVLDYYAARWTVETYFRVLKTGCKVERIQLETTARLKNCLALYRIIAARVLYLTHLNRTAPNLPCDAVFAPEEWKSVWSVLEKKPVPKKPPTLQEFMKLLLRLGGYNNRVKEAPAGPQPMWNGIRRMMDFSRAWLAFGPDSVKSCV